MLLLPPGVIQTFCGGLEKKLYGGQVVHCCLDLKNRRACFMTINKCLQPAYEHGRGNHTSGAGHLQWAEKGLLLTATLLQKLLLDAFRKGLILLFLSLL